MDQSIINALLAGFGTLLGILLTNIWQAVKDLQAADIKLTEKVSEIEVLVAGHYIKRDEFSTALDRVFHKLEAIEKKIDAKADK